jgi:hypothetical protein
MNSKPAEKIRMGRKRRLLLAAAALAVSVGYIAYRTTSPGRTGYHRATASAEALSTHGKERGPASYAKPVLREAGRLSASQIARIDRAFDLHRPSTAPGQFTDLKLNPELNRLHLTDEQVNLLEEAFDKLREARLAYEASIANVSLTATGSVRLDIPAYREEGTVLEKTLQDDLVAKFGNALAGEISAEYLPEIAGANAGFGQQVQTYVITANAPSPGLTTVERIWSAPDGAHGTSVSQVPPNAFWYFGAISTFFPDPDSNP